jgi:hypothetical protein
MPSNEDLKITPKAEPPRPQVPLSGVEAQELLEKCGVKNPFTPAELERARANEIEISRLQADEKNLCDLEARSKRDRVLAGYGEKVANGDLAGAREIANDDFFPFTIVQQKTCQSAINTSVAKRRTVLSSIVEAALQRTHAPIAKALAGLEQRDKQYAFEIGAESVVFRKSTLAARNWPQVGTEALHLLLREALAEKK